MIDWEEQLSHIVGDVLAHRLSNGVRHIHHAYRSSAQSFNKNLTQYLQEEAKLLPPREELEDFYHDVSALCEAVDQLEERIDSASIKQAGDG